jgi:DNA replication protein DnaC
MENFKNYVKEKRPDFIIDENNTPVIEKLLTAKNGLLIIGEYGCGKTMLIEIFANYTKEKLRSRAYRIANVREICFDFQKSGAAGIEKYYRIESGMNESFVYPVYCFDDLGTELPMINHYGTPEDVISNLLYLRYDAKVRTYASTNLNPQMLKSRYETRLYDRFKEMFEVIVMDGKSRRK